MEEKKGNGSENTEIPGYKFVLTGLWCFCGVNNLWNRLKSFIRFLGRYGAWKDGEKIITSGIPHKYDSASGLYVPYDPYKEKDVFRTQLYDTKDGYRKKIMKLAKGAFPYFVAITSICFNIVQCTEK